MKKTVLSIFFAAGLLSASADESPLWLRSTAISPDGSTIAFTYKGDIYTVPVAGGRGRRLTADNGFDGTPVWSRDGSRIAFASDRRGSDDIYIVDANGGTPRRITTHSGVETPLAWLDDNQLLFSANIAPDAKAAQGPFQAQLYTVDTSTPDARPVMYLSLPVTTVTADSQGRLIYGDKKGYEDKLRKHERSSGTSDLWLYDHGKFTRLTTFTGHDFEPVWLNGDTYAYVSEEDGTLNVWTNNLQGTAKHQITKFDTHPVRNLSAAADGSMAFSWNGEIYTISPGGDLRKVEVEIAEDDYDRDLVKRYVTRGATSMAVSPTGKEVAFVLRGDVYVTSTDYETTRRITNTPEQERNVQFSPDGRTLVYDSDREGHWQLFTATIDDKDTDLFTYAPSITEELLYRCETSAQQPAFSPDGKKVAFLENRTALRTIDLKSKKTVTALDGKWNYSYTDGDVSFEWSPDSRWFLTSYIGNGGWNNTDIALVKADGSEIIDLTESGFSDMNPKWALDGKAFTYESGRYGMKSLGSWGNTSDVLMMVLDGEAWDDFRLTPEEAELKEKADEKKNKDKDKDEKEDADLLKPEKVKALKFDLDNRKFRRARLTPMASFLGDYYLSPDGSKFYYVTLSAEGDANLYMRDLKEDEIKLVARNVNGALIPDRKGNNLYVNSGGNLNKISIPSGGTETIDFEALYDRHPSLEREYIYDHMLQQVQEKFYDPNLHGVDWKAYGEAYRRFLPHINNNRDFATLLSEILGELNASHTGGRYRGGGAEMSVGNLGAFFDSTYTGNGLKITELIARGPLTDKSADIRPGDIITAIDGQPILAGKDYYPLLEGKTGRKVRLTIDRKGRKSGDVTVKPISQGYLNNLLYQRWVEHNQAVVDSLSNGRVGYVHIKGMDSGSFSTIYDEILGKYRNCDALIVDTRYNGGGWLHNDVAQLLSGREYVRFAPRGQYIGSEPFSQWTKPSVMLVNEANYSDAYGTPFTYQALKVGDLVGAPVPGTMTAVWWETQIDPTLIFGIPQVTCTDLEGNALENRQLIPEVIIYNSPEAVLRGDDAQLGGAVRHLLEKTSSTPTQTK